MFTSEIWRLNHINLHHPERLERNLDFDSAPRHVDPAQLLEFNANKVSVEDLDAFPHLEHIETISDSESQPPPPPLQQIETCPGAGAPQMEYIAETWERDAEGCLETTLQNTS